MNRLKCAKCGKLLIDPIGSSKNILIAGEFPGQEEIMRGIPFVGPTGQILKSELSHAGLPFTDCRVTNLWIHAKDEKGCDLTMHLNALAKEMHGKKFALLMGSDLTKALFDCGVTELSGLEVKHELFPGTRVFISPNPAIVMHGPVGEFRLAVTRFADAVRRAYK